MDHLLLSADIYHLIYFSKCLLVPVFIHFFRFSVSLCSTLASFGEQWCQFYGFTDSLQSLQLNEIFEFEMYDISMASLCTWKNEAFEACVVMVTLPDRVPVLPVKNFPYPIPEESATRHSPTCDGIELGKAGLRVCYQLFVFYWKLKFLIRMTGGCDSSVRRADKSMHGLATLRTQLGIQE